MSDAQGTTTKECGGQQPQTATPQSVMPQSDTPQRDTGLSDGCLEGEGRGEGLLRCWKQLGELWGRQYRRQVCLYLSLSHTHTHILPLWGRQYRRQV
jgi:hypothetical protein